MIKKVIKDKYNNKGNIEQTDNKLPELITDIEKVTEQEALITDKAIVIVGSVDSGKSTTLGVLTTNILDDGNGSSRVSVARHAHEILSGKSSDTSTRILKFPNNKTCTLIDGCGHSKYMHTMLGSISGMYPDIAFCIVSPSRTVVDITRQHFRMLMSHNIPVMFIVTHIDMAIEESCKIVDNQIKELCDMYKRKTDFINGYTHYHSYTRGSKLVAEYGITTDTNLDMIDDSVNKNKKFTEIELEDINTYLKSDTFKLAAVNQINQGFKMANGRQNYISVVYISNVDGYFLDVVKQSMMTVEPRDLWSNDENANSIVRYFRTKLNLPRLGLDYQNKGATFYIDNTYMVKGVSGIVVSGIDRGDAISINNELYLGPFNKEFIKVRVRSIHNDKRDVVEQLLNHHRGCIAIKGLKDDLKKNQIKRGMVLLSHPDMLKNVCYRFEAAVTIFGGISATLRTGYSPVIHAGTIRQAAKMFLPDDILTEEEQQTLSLISKREKIEKNQRKIKSGDVEKVIFKFRMHSEFVDEGMVFVFRSGDLHGVGCVIRIIGLNEDNDAKPEPAKKKFRKVRSSDISREKEVASTKRIEKVQVHVK